MAHTKLFCVTWRCPDNGNVQEWFTTMNKAYARSAKIPAPSTIEEVEIPKTKVGLCRWLNSHFSTDNG